MHVEIEDFKTGWYGLTIGLKKNEINQLISALKALQKKDNHFHIRGDYNGPGGVGDIEFYIQDENQQNNLEFCLIQ